MIKNSTKLNVEGKEMKYIIYSWIPIVNTLFINTHLSLIIEVVDLEEVNEEKEKFISGLDTIEESNYKGTLILFLL